MLQTIRKLARDTKANVLLVTAIGASSLVGAAGIGVDTVQWYLWKRQLQQAVDSGAMAGALSLYQSADVTTNATNEISRNFSGRILFGLMIGSIVELDDLPVFKNRMRYPNFMAETLCDSMGQC